jgi:hypothetical protein
MLIGLFLKQIKAYKKHSDPIDSLPHKKESRPCNKICVTAYY